MIGAATVTACADGNPQRSASSGAGFVRYADAVQFAEDGLGPVQLVPFRDCVLGIRGLNNNSGLAWTGEHDCTRLVLSPERRSPGYGESGTALDASSAVAMDDGSIIGANEYLQRRDPGGAVWLGARLPDHMMLTAKAGHRFLVAGAAAPDDSWGAFVWRSSDGGATAEAVRLPQPPGTEPNSAQISFPALMAADGNEALVIGKPRWVTSGQPQVWHSADGGTTWTLSVAGDVTSAVKLLRSAGRWVLLGGVHSGGWPQTTSRATVYTSVDGRRWTQESSAGFGAGAVIDATVDRNGELVIIGQTEGPQDKGYHPTYYCTVLWAGPVGGPVDRRELGCGPHEPYPAMATLADGRVVIALGRDLLVRG